MSRSVWTFWTLLIVAIGVLLVFVVHINRVKDSLLFSNRDQIHLLISLEDQGVLILENLVVYELQSSTLLSIPVPLETVSLTFDEKGPMTFAQIHQKDSAQYASVLENVLSVPLDLHLVWELTEFERLFFWLGGLSVDLNSSLYRFLFPLAEHNPTYLESLERSLDEIPHHFFSYPRFLEYLSALKDFSNQESSLAFNDTEQENKKPSLSVSNKIKASYYEQQYAQFHLFQGFLNALIESSPYTRQKEFKNELFLLLDSPDQRKPLLNFLQRLHKNSLNNVALDSSRVGSLGTPIFFQYLPGLRETDSDGHPIFFPNASSLAEILRLAQQSLAQPERYGGKNRYTIQVLNGTSIRGLAERTARRFEQEKSALWEVVHFGNAPALYENTLIIDSSSLDAQGLPIASFLGCKRLIPWSIHSGLQNQDITVILGKDYQRNRCYEP